MSAHVLQLNVYPGLKGLKELLGHVPSWISYEEKERVEVCKGAVTVWTSVFDFEACARAALNHMLFSDNFTRRGDQGWKAFVSVSPQRLLL